MTSFLSYSDIAITIDIDVPVAYGGRTGPNLISNPGFETAGASPPVFSSWSEDTDSGNATIADETSTVRSGSHALRIESKVLASGSLLPTVDGGVYQDITVEPYRAYRLSFWSRASEEFQYKQGRFAIYDVTNSEWLVSEEDTYAFSDSQWEQVTRFFYTPAGCTSVRIWLIQNHSHSVSTGDSYVLFDDVDVRKLSGTSSAPSIPWGGVSDIVSYRHRITASGGFDTMTIGSVGSDEFLSNWLTEGLGRMVTVREAGSGIIWQGFINDININVGGLSINVGPFLGIINRGRISYSTINWNTTPPVPGEATKSVWHNVDTSQARFGIMEGNLTGGEESPTVMRNLVGTVVEVIAWPEVAQKFTLGTGLSMGITLNCLGYHRLMEKYFYIQSGIGGTENISTKIERIVKAHPTGLYKLSKGSVETNTVQAGVYENEDRTALDIIKELVAMGDADYNRYTWGVFDDFGFRYAAMTDEVAYVSDMQTKRILNPAGADVHPWNIRPGKWMYIAGFVGGAPQQRFALRDDPRYIFLETVDYVAPYGLTVDSGNANKFKQRIEQLGLGGI